MVTGERAAAVDDVYINEFSIYTKYAYLTQNNSSNNYDNHHNRHCDLQNASSIHPSHTHTQCRLTNTLILVYSTR